MKCICHFSAHPEIGHVFPCTDSNNISPEYYYHLVGEITRGVMKAAVCSLYYYQFGITYYYRVDIM